MEKIKVLIAEDFDILREDFCEMLDKQPDICVTGSASSGKDIVELAKHTPYDLILMDVEMETMTAGIQASEKIIEENPDAKIVFLTAHETRQMILTSMAAGAIDYIVKGCSEEELLEHIRAAVEGNPILDAGIQTMVLKEYTRLRRSEKSLLFFINNVAQLTGAERALVQMLLDGKTIRKIAQERCVEVVTVKTQIKSLLRKFGCSRTKEIVQMVRELQLEHLFKDMTN